MKFLNRNSNSRISINIWLILPVILLSVIGVMTLISTTILPDGGFGDIDIVYKQALFLILGVILFVVISYLDLSYLKYWQILLVIYLSTLLLLALTLFFAPTINNVKRWLIIAGIQIQPSEIAKVAIILTSAVVMSQKQKINEWILFFASLILSLPYFFLIYLEPDGSMGILTLVICFLISFLGLTNPLRNTILLLIIATISSAFLFSSITDNNLWYLLILPGIILAIFSFHSNESWKTLVIVATCMAFLLGSLSTVIWRNALKDYQKDRIVAFFNPSSTENDIGFNVNQSRIAIGSGRIFGKGFGNGTQSKRNFLPEHQTDFIFASFAEEFGLIGSLFLILLYGVIIVRAFSIAITSIDDPVFSLIALGIGIKILLEVFINIGTNTGAIPATGIPLPLMSAGGSITIMTYICLGLLHNIYSSTNNQLNMNRNGIVDIFEE